MRVIICLLCLIFSTTSRSNIQNNLTNCISLPLEYSQHNIPQTHITIDNHDLNFVIDFGLKDGLALGSDEMTQLSFDKQTKNLTIHQDLSGKFRLQEQGILSQVAINNMIFSNVAVSQAKPWGVWILPDEQAYQAKTLPVNAIGRDLFLNEKGVLYYSHQNQILRWCQTNSPSYDKHKKNIIWLPLQETAEGLIIQAHHQNKRLLLVIDSAASVSVIKPYHWLKQLPSHYDTSDLPLFYLDELKIANIPLKTLFLQYDFPQEFKADGLIGSTFFQNVDMIIDTVNRMLGLVFLSKIPKPII